MAGLAPSKEARELWASLIHLPVTKQNATSLLDPLISLVPRLDLDTQALTETIVLVLASLPNTADLFQPSLQLTLPQLQAWADSGEPAVHLLHLYLRFNLNTSLYLESSCQQMLSYALDHLCDSEWWSRDGLGLLPLLDSLMQQWCRNGGIWLVDRQFIGTLQGLIKQAVKSCPSDGGPNPSTPENIQPWCLGEPLHLASGVVGSFYEEHPYPRWVGLDLSPLANGLRGYLSTAVGAGAAVAIPAEPNRVLVLGCGTGREALGWAAALPQSHVEAVDLSGASLRHAMDMSHKLGLKNVDWHQEDLLRLPHHFADYDLVIASGVLHHLPDPEEGLLAVTRLARPGGLIKLALYSELARQPIVQAREILRATMAGEVSEEAFVHARIKLIEYLRQDSSLSCLLRIQEFFDIDGCWDLFFHPCEASFNLPDITQLLKHFKLHFLGFEWDDELPLRHFRALFPSDPEAVNLHYWACFEAAYSQTFLGMYRFWCRTSEL
jgi:SAM-dependent methyltransferase